ncbi:subtilase-type protease inhibitor [Streptomyces cellulosae]|uniref:subtilase-type protease inhibitor n=1 Tax=Streptomyces TaxID=1883 RepID=UPI00109E9117|nr:subtilase-type protease inhibitor [Streptomyces cellulosae]MXQ61315.1 alkaline protease [Streptomyces sp. XHT-2]THC58884.1 alkaline protease [Streptomyces sp. Akac8]WTB80209.1 subtilase-type protease inhibitor [Streptomyces cellulosae]WTC14956.1 subtilase-type protease inhibitor [Streptomyces cellulosae]
MRNTARWAITLGLTATAVCAPLSGAALAASGDAPSALYAPSALVLTVGKGVSATTATPERAVTLTCAPGPSGTHPAAGSACADLGAVGGDLRALTRTGDALCPMIYDPVVITVDGVWQGKRVSYERVFSNDCEMNAHGSSVFAF